MPARTRDEREERVTPLELFFDLIFVFAITQVTGLVVADPTWAGLVEGLLVLGVLWWAWAAYAWLTNTINPEEGIVRIAMFGAMAAMLIASLAVPDVFGDDAFLFACAYAVVRIAHLVLYAVAGRGDRDLLGAVARGSEPAVPSAIGPPLRRGGARRQGAGHRLGGRAARRPPGRVHRRRQGLASVARPLRRAPRADRDHRARRVDRRARRRRDEQSRRGRHRRCAARVRDRRALWWAYFDVVAIVAERRLPETEGNAQLAMARDSYSYLHLPMVAGIILFAVGVKKTLGDVGDPLKLVPAVALCGGVALYLVAHVLFRLRNVRTLNRQRLVVSVALLALLPAAVELPALATLALVAALCVGLIAYEAIRFAEARDRVRHAPEPAI